MSKQKGLIAALFFALALAVPYAEAQQTPAPTTSDQTTQAAPTGEQTIMLKGHHFRKAKGEAVIKDAAAGQKEVTINATGLKPNSTYTAWFAGEKKKDMSGIGTGDYSFKSDDKGDAHYTATVPGADLAKWRHVEVAYHPDNDPKNMKKMKIALKGDLHKKEKKRK